MNMFITVKLSFIVLSQTVTRHFLPYSVPLVPISQALQMCSEALCKSYSNNFQSLATMETYFQDCPQ